MSLLRFAAIASISLAAVCAVGAWPTMRWAGDAGIVSMALAAAVSLAGAIAGWLPMLRLSSPDADPADRANAILAGLAVRLGVTLAGVLVVLVGGFAPGPSGARGPFLAWLGVDYAVLLIVETRLAMRSVRSSRPAGGAPSA